ncbi:MAG: hypothetical protein F4204_11130 [Rhodospirillaceae bacterium]|nr:hypothetical protein [Rhodospirillaceae bacterium]
MNPDDAFERILALLYEAALDVARWPAASASIDEACGAVGNALVVGGRSGDIYSIQPLYRGEADYDVAREFFEVYYPHDEVLRRRVEMPDGRLVHASELYADTALRTSAAYNEGWRLLRAQNGINVSFEQPDGLRIFWGVGDPVGGDGWESAQVGLIERLLPHVLRSVLIRQALAAADALGSGLAGLLDNDRIGVVQLDRGGRVLAANGPALEILRRGDGLTDRDGALRAAAPRDDGRLQALLGRALPDLWGAAPEGGSMTVERPLRQAQGRLSGRPPLSLHVSPVGDAESDFGGRRVAALVLVVDPARRPRIDPVRVAASLGLTRSEARAAALLAEGRSVLEIADMTGWQAGYVRRLLKRIYRKQGVSGQVSLVPRVLALETLPQD